MKKVLLVGLLSCFLIPSAIADTYERTTSNGGPDGYDKTSHTETGNTGSVKTVITCTDPGHESCPTIYSPNPGIGLDANAQDICTTYALEKIEEGNLTGSQTIVIVSETYHVSWSSNQSGTNSSIQIWD